MNKPTLNKILAKLPPESAQYAVRDMTFLTCSIFNDTHFISFKKFFGVPFSMLFWYGRPDGQICLYRPGPEYDRFAKKVGQGCRRSLSYTKKIAKTLIKMTDDLYAFMKKNKDLAGLLTGWQGFYELYRDFFAYHQAVYWASMHLTELKVGPKEKKKMDLKVKILDKAYKYNENVFPAVEAYIAKLGIGDLVYDEVDASLLEKKKKVPKKRSILTLDKKTYILPLSKARVIDKAIRADYQKYLKNLKEVKGLAVSKGVAKGRVRLVLDLSKLAKCQKGDILVTTQTRPQYNSAINKVAGIVTDEGGYLCHASMLAREFKIPCIVGTKNATKLLKNGDLVEVDASKGIITIIKIN